MQGVWIPIEEVLGRIRQRKARRTALRDVTRRLAAQPAPRKVDAETRRRAAELQRLKDTLSSRLGRPEACQTCARNHPPPHGQYEGGYCCGGNTEDLFRDRELFALKVAGTRPRHLRPASDPPAGCVFRGAEGCSLPPKHRPNLCVRYVCPTLARELQQRGDAPTIRQLMEELERGLDRLVDLAPHPPTSDA